MYLASGLPNTAPGKDPKEKRSMAPTMPVSVPSVGGSKNAIPRCVVAKCRKMRYASVACLPGVATSSQQGMELPCQASCSKQQLPEILTVCSCPTSWYQLSDDHAAPLLPKGGTRLISPLLKQRVLRHGLINDNLYYVNRNGNDFNGM